MFSKGIRVGKGIFLTCPHGVMEQLDTESESKHFRRDKVYVDGHQSEILLIGSSMPWDEDIAFLRAVQPELDNGPVATIRQAPVE